MDKEQFESSVFRHDLYQPETHDAVFEYIRIHFFGFANEYGVNRSNVFPGASPISPRSTASPGAVGVPGARQYISQ
jgi:hypothetical protein